MAYSLNQIQPGTTYAQAATIEGLEPCVKANLDVANGSIFFQIKAAYPGFPPSGAWGPEVQMLPGSKSITRSGITGARVRAAAVTTPATIVTVEIVNAMEGL